MKPIFISGIGTGIGKTIVSAIITEALEADYWKPVQAGFTEGTDSLSVSAWISNKNTVIHPESYKLRMPASPHIAAKAENIRIDIQQIEKDFQEIKTDRPLVIEGAGGLFVPLNEEKFVIDLVKALDARLVLVSRHYLGSINHSLMTARLCRSAGLDVAGWIFNDQYLDYAPEIASWSGYPALFALPLLNSVNRTRISEEALRFRADGKSYLYPSL